MQKNKRMARSRERPAQIKKAGSLQKLMEFMKKIVVWVLMYTAFCTAASYLLSAMGMDPCAEITLWVVKLGFGVVVAYAAKSLFEKALRDIFGLDKDGKPYSLSYSRTNTNNAPAEEEAGG